MNFKLEKEFSKADILKEVDALKKQIDDMRPLPADVEARVMQKLRLDWNYNSNAIEGNKLSYGETVALLQHGTTAKGKPLKDHLDIQGHNQAVEYLELVLKDERNFTEVDIRTLHELILVEPYYVDAETNEGLSSKKYIQIGRYKSSANHVRTITGAIHYYATPEETPAKMLDLMNWFVEAVSVNEIHPVVLAALFHHKFVSIHPFDDGNGRVTRILMNLILMKKGFPPVVVKKEDKDNYYSLLSRADSGEDFPFIEYITERLRHSLTLYLKAIYGNDIDEDEDVDKEIELLKMQLNGGIVAKEKKSKTVIFRVFKENLLPLSVKVDNKLSGFKDFFFKGQKDINIFYNQGTKNYNAQYKIEEDASRKLNLLLNNVLTTLKDIQISIKFQDYKDPDNRFDIDLNLNYTFEEFYYKIFVESELISSKLYHENLTQTDYNKIIKQVLNTFKIQLNKKSPKS